MQFDNVVIKVTDGIKQGDYAPNKVYDLTGMLNNAAEADIVAGIQVLLRAGEAYLGRSVAPATTTTTKAKPVEKPAPLAEKPAASAPAPASDPAPVAAEPVETAPSSDISDLIDGGEVKEITNDEIVHAVMKKNEALKDATKIRALVETYNPAPGLRVFKATEIEQKDRAGFIEKLTELTA